MHPQRPLRNGQRGAIAVLAAIVLIAVGGFLALSLNVGHLMNAKAELQAAADAAALAGARALNGGDVTFPNEGYSNSHDVALAIAAAHRLDTMQVALGANAGNLASGDIVRGYWNPQENKFYTQGQTILHGVNGFGDEDVALAPPGLGTPTVFLYNAVKVTLGTDGGNHNSPLQTFFSNFIGRTTAPTFQASAIAVGGGPCAEDSTVLPMVIEDCRLINVPGDGSVKCGGNLITISFASHFDVAFADLTQPSDTTTEQEVFDQTGFAMAGTAPQVSASGTNRDISTNDGSTFLPTSNAITRLRAVTGLHVIPVMHLPGFSICGGSLPSGGGGLPGQFGAVLPVGFIYATITNVGAWTSAATRTITISNDCQTPSNYPGGCADFGFKTNPIATTLNLTSHLPTPSVRLVK